MPHRFPPTASTLIEDLVSAKKVLSEAGMVDSSLNTGRFTGDQSVIRL